MRGYLSGLQDDRTLDGLDLAVARAELARELCDVIAGRRGPGALADWMRAGGVGTDPARWDARFAEYLDAIGTAAGDAHAARWRELAAKRREERIARPPVPGDPASAASSWYGWITPDQPTPQFAAVLASALWPEVRERMLRGGVRR